MMNMESITVEDCMDNYFKRWRGVMINDGKVNGFDEGSKNSDLRTPYSDCLHWL